jgi:hypothetical protein
VEGKKYLDDVFDGVADLQGAIVTITPGAELGRIFRARVAQSEAEASALLKEPAARIGPPPPSEARAGRMNPAGISVFYGAFKEHVAVAEVRPSIGAHVVVGAFLAVRDLRVLDLTFLARAYHQESMFSPRFQQVMDRIAFLEEFHRRVSRPIQPHEELLEYLPTQAIAEYVSNVMKLDGLIYQSVQVSETGKLSADFAPERCNVVLFRPSTPSLPEPSGSPHATGALKFEEGSAHVVLATSIQITYERVELTKGDEETREKGSFGLFDHIHPPELGLGHENTAPAAEETSGSAAEGKTTETR